jgi:hypothetical protein
MFLKSDGAAGRIPDLQTAGYEFDALIDRLPGGRSISPLTDLSKQDKKYCRKGDAIPAEYIESVGLNIAQ